MLERIGLNTDILFICMFVFIFALIVLVFVLLNRVNRLSKVYSRFIKGANGKSLEEKFIQIFTKMDEITEENVTLRSKVAVLDDRKKAGFCKFAITKFDAFDSMGGKLSYSLCLLDDNNNGFILTSMHNSDGCYSYLKEVINGKPFIKLSENEKIVLDEAITKSNPLSKYIGDK